MKHLYIIGNGFDIHTGLKTQFTDFVGWLERNYPFISEDLNKAYNFEGKDWHDFETELGKLDIHEYVQRFTPTQLSENEIIKNVVSKNVHHENDDNIPSLYEKTPCANRLRGLLDVLQYCFTKWVEDVTKNYSEKKRIKIIKEDSYFINFNYTDTLELLYNIPENKVCHIHGRVSKHERLIFGHRGNNLTINGSHDEDRTQFELNIFEKNPYEYIYRNNLQSLLLDDVKQIHVYGFSFSQVDEDYMDWIYKHTPHNCIWEISFYTLDDKKRIETFISDYPDLLVRTKMIKLDALTISR